MADQLYGLTKERRDELLRLLDWWRNVRGTGVRNTPWGMSIGSPRTSPPRTPSPPRDWRWAKIITPTVVSPNRWFYFFRWQRETASGWEDDTDATDPVDLQLRAYNSIEAFNTGSGIQGNSIDHDGGDYPAGFSLQPVRGNPVVQMWIGVDQDGAGTYRFSYVNAEDGTCD